MEAGFSGTAEFCRQEGKDLPALALELEARLAELERLAKGQVKTRFSAVRMRLAPGFALISKAACETMLDPRQILRLRGLFELEMREGTPASGPIRIAIEKVVVLLRIIDLRVTAIVGAMDPRRTAEYRKELLEDLWFEPIDVRASPEGELDWRRLPPELHRAWLARLDLEWRSANWYYLGDALRPPKLELIDTRQQLGRWDPATRTIGVSGWLIVARAWHEVLETLKHEMAHQLVSEAWGLSDSSHESGAFRSACEKLRCSPAASVDPRRMIRVEDSQDPTDRIVAKIYKLLRLGTSTNQHEAALAMERASALLAKYNLDASALDRERNFFRRWLGQPLARREEYHHTLVRILEEHFFVRVIWESTFDALTAAGRSQLVVVGTRENLDIAEYTYDFLDRTLEQLWRDHRASEAHRGGRKSQYLAGVTRGFLGKLDEQRSRLITERALVWRRDSRLETFYDHLYPHRSSTRIGGVSRGDDYHTGIEHGREISLRMGVTEKTAGSGRFLPPGKPTRGE